MTAASLVYGAFSSPDDIFHACSSCSRDLTGVLADQAERNSCTHLEETQEDVLLPRDVCSIDHCETSNRRLLRVVHFPLPSIFFPVLRRQTKQTKIRSYPFTRTIAIWWGHRPAEGRRTKMRKDLFARRVQGLDVRRQANSSSFMTTVLYGTVEGKVPTILRTNRRRDIVGPHGTDQNVCTGGEW